MAVAKAYLTLYNVAQAAGWTGSLVQLIKAAAASPKDYSAAYAAGAPLAGAWWQICGAAKSTNAAACAEAAHRWGLGHGKQQ
jgi:hypothetical protein